MQCIRKMIAIILLNIFSYIILNIDKAYILLILSKIIKLFKGLCITMKILSIYLRNKLIFRTLKHFIIHVMKIMRKQIFVCIEYLYNERLETKIFDREH